MSLIIGLGSNLGNRAKNIELAVNQLSQHYSFIKQSQTYKSDAVDYTMQPYFLNSVVEFKVPKIAPAEIMKTCLAVESKLGRLRDIPKGPRVIDIDILFINTEHINITNLVVPHPRLFSRSFVVLPLKEIPFFKTLEKSFDFSDHFETASTPISSDK